MLQYKLAQRVLWRKLIRAKIAQTKLPQYLYHVSYLHSLNSIQRNGLRLGSGQTFGGGYGGHSRGRIFLTTSRGVTFWFDRYEMLVSNLTDHPEEGWVPVVLRVATAGIPPTQIDTAGTQDASSNAFFIEQNIPPNMLEAYDGRGWKRLRSVDPDKMLEQVLEASEFDMSDEDGEGDWYMAEDFFKPRL